MKKAILVLSLMLTAAVLGADLDIQVVEPPSRLGEAGATAILRGSFPSLRVIPTGSGELVVRGTRAEVAAAMALMRKLDRPPREIIVEVRREVSDFRRDGEWRLGIGVGGEEAPSVFRRTRGSNRSFGGQSLRLREGSSATLFVGDEVPYSSGGVFPQTRFVSAGSGVKVRLVRVDPGNGALLEIGAEHGGLGAATPAGPTIHRERVGTQVFAEFGVPTPIASFSSSAGESLRTGGVTGALTIEETRMRDPNAAFRQGSRGIPTGRFLRRPLRGTISVGRRITSGAGGGGYTVVVREVPSADRRPSIGR